MGTKQHVLVIDDDPDYCKLMSEVLSEKFDCSVSYSGEEGLLTFKHDVDPILVIVDLNLPDISGFDVCLALKALKATREFAIFVISGDEENSSRIRAFEAGADDYIAKPFELEELSSRIDRSIDYIEGQSKLKQEGHATREMANIAMAQASQYSYVMNFFKSLNTCNNIDQVAKLFFDAMDYFALSATLKIHFNSVVFLDSDLGDVSPIEKSIYELLEHHGRIYEFGKRMLINGRNVSFLVKNFPEDEISAGQARDFLAALVEGLESKIDDLILKTSILDVTSGLTEAIETINQNLSEHNIIINNIMSDMVTDISTSYHKLDLNDEQEVYFTDMVEKGSGRLNSADDLLKEIQASFDSLLLKMKKVEEMSKPSDDNQVESADNLNLF